MPQCIIKDILEWADSVPNPRGTLRPAEHGTISRRKVEEAAQVHLSSARSDIIQVMENDAKEKSWQKKNWSAYRRLYMIAKGIEIGEWQEPEKDELDFSTDEENLAMDIDPILLDDNDVKDVEVDDPACAEAQDLDMPDNKDELDAKEQCWSDRLRPYNLEDFLYKMAHLRQQVQEQQDFGEEEKAKALDIIQEFERKRLSSKCS